MAGWIEIDDIRHNFTVKPPEAERNNECVNIQLFMGKPKWRYAITRNNINSAIFMFCPISWTLGGPSLTGHIDLSSPAAKERDPYPNSKRIRREKNIHLKGP